MKIGFIGLGIMGAPMARNLLAAGYNLVIKTSQPHLEKEFTDAGATAAHTPAAVAREVDIVFTMLPDSPEVKSVALGTDGITEGAHDGLIHVDCSSIDPAVSREVGEELAKVGITVIDAPVSGGEPFAISGQLSFMVGGEAAAVEKVRPILEKMGKSVVHVGELGAGNITKLANQAIVAVNIAVVAEALVLAKKSGVDPANVISAISGGLAGSNVLNAKGPMMLDHNFAPGFRSELHRKDLLNTLAAARQSHTAMPLTALVHQQLETLLAQGEGQLDHSALLKIVETNSNTSIKE